MKVLFLTGATPVDYLEYFTYNGLCQVLGDENVVTFPYQKNYSELSDWRFIKLRKQNTYTLEEINDMQNRGEFCYTFITPRFDMKTYEKIILPFNRICILDGEDKSTVIDKDPHTAVFRRELKNLVIPNLFPLPFSSYIIDDERFNTIDDTKKEYDVFICMSKLHGRYNIGELVNTLVEMKDITIKTILYDSVGPQSLVEYLSDITKSKISISLRGAGEDTVRFWEIPSYNTMLLTDMRYNVIPLPFLHGLEAMYFEEINQVPNIITKCLQNNLWQEIAKAGNAKLKAYHTNAYRAKYILNILRDVYG